MRAATGIGSGLAVFAVAAVLFERGEDAAAFWLLVASVALAGVVTIAARAPWRIPAVAAGLTVIALAGACIAFLVVVVPGDG